MEKITYKKLLNSLTSKAILGVSAGLLLVSCGAQMGGYSETDGVYYDPNNDTLPQGAVMNGGNQIGDYYDYQAKENENKYLNSDNRESQWQESQDSDWGNYTGTSTYYSDYGSPFGFYSGFGYGMSFGWGYGGFGSPFGYGFDPYFGYYNPWGYSPFGYNSFFGYNPYFGYSPYYGYNPYYGGYGNNYYGNGYNGYNSYNGGFTYKRSGSDGSFRDLNRSQNTSTRMNNTSNNGFRNEGTRSNPNATGTRPGFNENTNPGGQRFPTNRQPNIRQNTPRQQTPRQSAPDYNSGSRDQQNNSGFRGNSGGFNNSGSSSSGSSNSGRSSGGFRR